jgi:hypothetical protein
MPAISLSATITKRSTAPAYGDQGLDRVHDDLCRPSASVGSHLDAQELLTRLDARGFTAAVQEIEQGSGGLSWLRLYLSLAVRHAGGQLFQEAHFELLRGATEFDLFGLVGAPEVAEKSRRCGSSVAKATTGCLRPS